MMKRPYRNIGFFFLLIFALVVVGFTPHVPGTPFFGYFSRVINSSHVVPAIHLHAFVALAWFALLATQPFLIKSNRLNLHRVLGWTSIALVIVFFLTALQMMKNSYAHGILEMPREAVLSQLAQSFTALSLFLLFYTLSILSRRNLYKHVAFMVAAALAAATPGLARLALYVIGGLPAILVVLAAIYATLVGFMLYAKIRLNQDVLRGPYLPIIALFFAAHAMDFVGSQTAGWLWFAGKMVTIW